MQPKCGFCGSTEYKAVSSKQGGTDLVIVICSKCGAILAAANKK